jgi:5-methyltetrahydropteroyltriglutamate--homocysteine methyltransferase
MAVPSTVLGFPRIGANRELKKNTEAFWAGKINEEALLAAAKKLRIDHWKAQAAQGVTTVASGDFSFYDQVLDHAAMFNVIPKRYEGFNLTPLETYFAMGRGLQRPATETSKAVDVVACEMVKWFDSNYHNIRPEFSSQTEFKLNNTKPLDEYLEAKENGVITRPVIIGPVSFLYLGKPAHDSPELKPLSLLDKLLPVYKELLKKFADAGVEWVQVDEPILAYDLPEEVKSEFKAAYDYLATVDSRLKLLFTTYFGTITQNLDIISSGLNIQGLHIDLVRAPEQLDQVIAAIGPKTVLSVGVVDGRNIWKTNLHNAIALVQRAVEKLGKDRVFVASSSSLLHTPYSINSETKLSPEVKNWFSFALEKCKELAVIANVINNGPESEQKYLDENAAAIKSRSTSALTNDPQVKERFDSITQELFKRKSEYNTRKTAQTAKLHLPLFPTTTIGSFPQTKEIRQARNKLGKKEISPEEYEKFIEKEIQEMIKFQEEVGLDVFVHGEPERNDMVLFLSTFLLIIGSIFRRTTKGICIHSEWLGSIIRRSICPPSYCCWRRLPSRADDRQGIEIRP